MDDNTKPGSGTPEDKTAQNPAATGIDEESVEGLITDYLRTEVEREQAESPTPDGESDKGSEDDPKPPESKEPDGKDDDDGKDEPAWFKKRIDKITAARREAEEQVSDLKAQVQELHSKLQKSENPKEPEPEVASNRYDNIESLADIKAERARLVRDIGWCNRNRDGGTFTRDGKEFELTSEQVAEVAEKLHQALYVDLDARKETIEERARIKDRIHDVFPFFKDERSTEYKASQEVLKKLPELRKRPDYEWHVGLYMLGLATYQQQLQAAKNGKRSDDIQTVPPRAPSQPTAPSAAPAKATGSKRRSQLFESVAKTGDHDAVERYLEEIL
jgi:hypothetical protein